MANGAGADRFDKYNELGAMLSIMKDYPAYKLKDVEALQFFVVKKMRDYSIDSRNFETDYAALTAKQKEA